MPSMYELRSRGGKDGWRSTVGILEVEELATDDGLWIEGYSTGCVRAMSRRTARAVCSASCNRRVIPSVSAWVVLESPEVAAV